MVEGSSFYHLCTDSLLREAVGLRKLRNLLGSNRDLLSNIQRKIKKNVQL